MSHDLDDLRNMFLIRRMFEGPNRSVNEHIVCWYGTLGCNLRSDDHVLAEGSCEGHRTQQRLIHRREIAELLYEHLGDCGRELSDKQSPDYASTQDFYDAADAVLTILQANL